MKQALIVQGGWQGHEPRQVSEIMASGLRSHGVAVEIVDTLDALRDLARLKALDLIVMSWTQGRIEREQLTPLLQAVAGGVGLGGVHGGLGDSFRDAVDYQFMVGGQWVAHPGNDGVEYVVNIVDHVHPITRGLKDFGVKSEQYYMHVDPAIHVLATTSFGSVQMPVAWTKMWGKGRVFYCSLGHVAQVFDQDPQIRTLVTRGLLWAAEGKALA